MFVDYHEINISKSYSQLKTRLDPETGLMITENGNILEDLTRCIISDNMILL